MKNLKYGTINKSNTYYTLLMHTKLCKKLNKIIVMFLNEIMLSIFIKLIKNKDFHS